MEQDLCPNTLPSRAARGKRFAFPAAVTEWMVRVRRAVERVGTPCYVTAWAPMAAALARLDTLPSPLPIRSWFSFKTHPLLALARQWLASGRGVEVVSERELLAVLALNPPVDQLLVNGVAKHSWLQRHRLPRLRVHFDSVNEIDALLPNALEERWRVGVRVQVPDEKDAREPAFRGQFGLSRREAVAALFELADAGADVQSLHFHLGQHQYQTGAYERAVDYVASVCADAGVVPLYLDCGGALPSAHDARNGAAMDDLSRAIARAAERLPGLREIWLENGRFVCEPGTALVVTVLDLKERPDSRYLICDGGRTNQALASRATSSRVPGSSNRWVAPGTIRSWFSHRSSDCAARLSSITVWSRPPTMSRVGARTCASLGPARSGRPPRETMAATGAAGSAAA